MKLLSHVEFLLQVHHLFLFLQKWPFIFWCLFSKKWGPVRNFSIYGFLSLFILQAYLKFTRLHTHLFIKFIYLHENRTKISGWQALELKTTFWDPKLQLEKKNEAIILMGSVERCCLWNSHEPATAPIVYSVVPVKEKYSESH